MQRLNDISCRVAVILSDLNPLACEGEMTKVGAVTLSLSKGRAQRPYTPCFDWLSMTPVLKLVKMI